MKKFMLAISAIVMCVLTLTITPSNVSATTDNDQVVTVCNYLYSNSLETIDSQEIETYKQTVTDGLILVEQIKADEERKATVDNFDGRFNLILKSYKDFLIDYEIELLYKPSEYAYSENGVIKLNNAKATATHDIEYANSKSQADEAFNVFKNLVNSNELVKNVNVAQTVSDATITGSIETTDGANIFSPDDEVIISKFTNSVVIKNAKVALMGNENLLTETSGVAYYFTVEYKQNGVIKDEAFSSPVKVKIKVEDLELDLQDGDAVQIVTYGGNHKVSLMEASIVDGNLTFILNSPGEYGLVADGYALKNRSYVVQFFIDYGVYVGIGFVVVLIIILPIRARRKAKRKEQKRLKKEFNIFKKNNKRQEKQNKKKKRNKKGVK